MSNKKLVEKLLKAANNIHHESIKGSANYIVISPKFAEMIDNLDIKRHRKKKLNKIFKSQNED